MDENSGCRSFWPDYDNRADRDAEHAYAPTEYAHALKAHVDAALAPVTIDRCPVCNVPTHATEGDDEGRCVACSQHYHVALKRCEPCPNSHDQLIADASLWSELERDGERSRLGTTLEFRRCNLCDLLLSKVMP